MPNTDWLTVCHVYLAVLLKWACVAERGSSALWPSSTIVCVWLKYQSSTLWFARAAPGLFHNVLSSSFVMQVRAGEALLRLTADIKECLILNDLPALRQQHAERSRQLQEVKETTHKTLSEVRQMLSTDLQLLEDDVQPCCDSCVCWQLLSGAVDLFLSNSSRVLGLPTVETNHSPLLKSWLTWLTRLPTTLLGCCVASWGIVFFLFLSSLEVRRSCHELVLVSFYQIIVQSSRFSISSLCYTSFTHVPSAPAIGCSCSASCSESWSLWRNLVPSCVTFSVICCKYWILFVSVCT